MSAMNSSAKKVQDALNKLGYDLLVTEFAETTRTAQEAADAIGTTVAQIAKSLIFKGKQSNKPILIIASGVNRVNEKTVKETIGEKLGRADADYVRQHTGFVIGGVPPVGHTYKLSTFIDEDLLSFEDIWAAAGTPNAVFNLTPQQLVEMTGGQVISIQ